MVPRRMDFPEPDKTSSQGYSAQPEASSFQFQNATSSSTTPANSDRGLLSGLAMGGIAHHFQQNRPSSAQGNPQQQVAPPAYASSSSQAPPAGNRVPCSSSQPFPQLEYLGSAPFHDLGGQPVYVASAILGDSVQPCKAAPHLPVACHYPFAGVEQEHQGRYDVLPITDQMEWVPTRQGIVPKGRKSVEGGYERDGRHLFHAAAAIQGIRVPGKTGQHLGAANIAFGGSEVIVQDHDILCWR